MKAYERKRKIRNLVFLLHVWSAMEVGWMEYFVYLVGGFDMDFWEGAEKKEKNKREFVVIV